MARWNRLTKGRSFFAIWQGAGTITKNSYLLRANRQYTDPYSKRKRKRSSDQSILNRFIWGPFVQKKNKKGSQCTTCHILYCKNICFKESAQTVMPLHYAGIRSKFLNLQYLLSNLVIWVDEGGSRGSTRRGTGGIEMRMTSRKGAPCDTLSLLPRRRRQRSPDLLSPYCLFGVN